MNKKRGRAGEPAEGEVRVGTSIRVIHGAEEVRARKDEARKQFEEVCVRANVHVPEEYLERWWR